MSELPNIEVPKCDDASRNPAKRRDIVRAQLISTRSFAIAMLLLLTVDQGLLNCAQDPAWKVNPRISANQLVREVIHNQLQAQIDDQTLWRYRDLKEKGGRSELRQVIETKDGELDRLLDVNREPLTAAQDQMEDGRIQKLLAHPDEIRKEQRTRREDNQKEDQLLQSFPRAFIFQYDGVDGNLIGLGFTPNPHFHASNRQELVFHHMEGTMWIDGSQKRLAGMDGHLTSRVKFGGGLLGHLNQGGTFSMRLKDVGSGHWSLDSLDIQITGKALFFKTIGLQQKERCTDYSPIPENMTLRRAAQLLREESRASLQPVKPRPTRN